MVGDKQTNKRVWRKVIRTTNLENINEHNMSERVERIVSLGRERERHGMGSINWNQGTEGLTQLETQSKGRGGRRGRERIRHAD